MDIIQIIVLCFVQGLTEFLPISSSAHLILIPHITGWADQGLLFDVSTHIGSLLAILVYFRRDLAFLLRSWLRSLVTRELTPASRLVWGILLGTIPIGLMAIFLLVTGSMPLLRNPIVPAVSMAVFGLLLGLADGVGRKNRDEYTMSWRDMWLIGLAQALALIPGTSRSGVTMTMALFLGFSRKAAARYSFLLAIPAVLMAGTEQVLELVLKSSGGAVVWMDMGLGVFFSALFAYGCIHLFLGIIDRVGMLPFVVYRLVVAVLIWVWLV